jgi:hypothetical protein
MPFIFDPALAGDAWEIEDGDTKRDVEQRIEGGRSDSTFVDGNQYQATRASSPTS